MTQATSPGGESPSKIIVPFDGSDLSSHALPVAHTLARCTGDTIVLLQVVGHHNEAADARDSVNDTASRLSASDVRVDQVVVEGKPAERIIEQAAEQHARFVVMATHGRSGLGRWIYGSVADEVMRNSTTPVVIVPTGFTNRAETYTAGRIVVALDGSATAEQSLPHAIALAKDLNDRLVLVRIVVPILVTDGGLMLEPVVMQPDDTDAQKADAEAYLARAANYVRTQGVEVETRVVVGDTQVNTGVLISGLVARETATLLDRIALETPGSLITLTTQGHGGLGRALLGSVATAALQHAHVPVLICRSIEDAVAVVPVA